MRSVCVSFCFNRVESDASLVLLLEHDLVRKPVPTFRDHALTALVRIDDFRHGDAELVLDQHDLAARHQAVIDIDVDRLADAAVQLISPFVGRIYDWHKRALGAQWDEAKYGGANDPGVQSVTRIYQYYKKHGIATEIMGASFRNTGQILALAGCDLLTISPELLAELEGAQGDVPARLTPELAQAADIPRADVSEVAFRTQLNEDAMATEKLAEGIRVFAADAVRLDAIIEQARG